MLNKIKNLFKNQCICCTKLTGISFECRLDSPKHNWIVKYKVVFRNVSVHPHKQIVHRDVSKLRGIPQQNAIK